MTPFRHTDSAFLLPHSPFRRHRLRSGMTMIELVAALALFVLILGTLLTVMDTVTSLWSSSRSQQTEQTKAENIADIIADDLYEAVTDNGVPTNSASVKIKPTFILSTPPTNSSPSDVTVTVVLGFARHASPRTYSEGGTANRISLDAVFYTYYKNALFRHAIPLSYISFDNPETLGDLLDNQLQKIKNAELHDKILASIQNPATEVPAAWSYLLLAERIETEWVATLPKTYIENASDGSETVSSGEIEAFALPDKLAMAVRIYSEADWAAYQSLKNDNSDEAALKKRRLGSFYSKLISFPAKGGSRLP